MIESTTLTVTHNTGEYPVIIGTNLIDDLNAVAQIPESDRVVIVTDDQIGPLFESRTVKSFERPLVVTVPAGEKHKTLETVRTVYDQMLDAEFSRQTTVISLGGGVVNDMTGFVAASYMRGVRFVTCPTSLLAMVDASVGGKTGVDMPHGKNLIGAFKQPIAVLVDLTVLKTLPKEEFSAGMSELIKHGLISDPSLLDAVFEYDWYEIIQREDDPVATAKLRDLIAQAIEVKRAIVQEDPFEGGRRALLNLGHTFGHAIEQVMNFEIRHGEGVAMGLVCAAHMSAALGYCDPALQGQIEKTLEAVDLPTRIPAAADPELMLQAMQHDKKKKDGKVRFILMRDIGDVFIDPSVPEARVLETLNALRASA